MISAVFDCMVFLQAAANDRSPGYACLEFAESNQIRLFVNQDILTEVQDVLTRPAIQARFPRLTPARVAVFLQKVVDVAVVGNAPDAGFPLRDPDDLPYLNLAVAENVEYLVSRDKDLLDLMGDPAFLQSFPNLQVVDPVAFLNAVRTAQSP